MLHKPQGNQIQPNSSLSQVHFVYMNSWSMKQAEYERVIL